MKLTKPEKVLASVTDCIIESSELPEEGVLHLILDDGRTLVFAGDFAIAVIRTPRTIQ